MGATGQRFTCIEWLTGVILLAVPRGPINARLEAEQWIDRVENPDVLSVLPDVVNVFVIDLGQHP